MAHVLLIKSMVKVTHKNKAPTALRWCGYTKSVQIMVVQVYVIDLATQITSTFKIKYLQRIVVGTGLVVCINELVLPRDAYSPNNALCPIKNVYTTPF